MNLPKRRMGRTNLMVTELGLGAMDTPQVEEGSETLKLALDSGINFVDTARNSDGNPDSPQAVVFSATIVDVTVGS